MEVARRGDRRIQRVMAATPGEYSLDSSLRCASFRMTMLSFSLSQRGVMIQLVLYPTAVGCIACSAAVRSDSA
jgi:hypothetical protein